MAQFCCGDTTVHAKGFYAGNGTYKVRMCVFPKHFDYNHNEPPCFPFEKTDGRWDVHRPCFAYWDMPEKRLGELDRMGIQGDLILFHPYDPVGVQDDV